jgi:hypothetical protein
MFMNKDDRFFSPGPLNSPSFAGADSDIRLSFFGRCVISSATENSHLWGMLW